jgi:predicted acyltransferase
MGRSKSRIAAVTMKQRNQSLDALRGLAIFAMVLAGSIAFGILPAWMYHAQEPPPTHAFMPALPGISWVDLVFPFFLFSMGAAIPFSLKKKIKEQQRFPAMLEMMVKRYFLLVFFALFTKQLTVAGLSRQPGTLEYLLPILAFGLLFVLFYAPVAKSRLWLIAKGMAVLLIALLLYALPFENGTGFSLYNSDIIILILANVSLAGTLCWYFTRHHPLWRIALLLLLMGVFLSGTHPGNWCHTLLSWSPWPWMYTPEFLKYLFILLPGTLAGDWMLQYGTAHEAPVKQELIYIRLAALCAAIVLVCNVCLLFGRHTTINLFMTVAGLLGSYAALRKTDPQQFRLLHLFLKTGAYLVVLGLCFESFEGGIKKDPATFSYYFVTTGLAFLVLIIFYSLQYSQAGSVMIHYLSLTGRNPMVAYVAGNLLLLPLLHLSGGIILFESMGQQVWTGVLRGVLFTGMVSALAAWCSRRQWYWKT